ncbi:MAG: winged helix-turn-helix domain-containing protein [Parachlamydiales bacterium]
MEGIDAVEGYVYEVLDVQLKLSSWAGAQRLPFYLLNTYDFYEMVLLGVPCVVMAAKEGVALTPLQVKRHQEELGRNRDGMCIYVEKAMPAYNRKRLIQQHVPFIVPGNQLYLPGLGIDLRERFVQTKPLREKVRPATQVVILYALLNGKRSLSLSDLAKALPYSRMTLTRAFDELETAGIGRIERQGRERLWRFRDGRRALWEQGKPLLRSPVKQRIYLKQATAAMEAGLTALSQRSALNGPSIPIKAASSTEASSVPYKDEAVVELEIWRYPPEVLAVEGRIDPFSLYLSLEGSGDERVEMALEQMMEEIAW